MTAIDDIGEGVYDGQLGDVIAAVLERVVETESTLNWRITLDGDTWDAETVSLMEFAEAEKLARTSFLNLDPTRQASHLVALIVAHFVVFGSMELKAAIEKASKYTAADLKNIVILYETPAVGKDSGRTSTDS